MKSPKSFRIFQSGSPYYPDYYLGQNFAPGMGVHRLSTVFSHWFYLLAMGTTEFTNNEKTNEVGDIYNFEGIGIQNAADIIFQVVSESQTLSNATYPIMREATIQTALDLNYDCFLPSIINAWNCVGVYGDHFYNNTLTEFTFNNDTILDSVITFQKVAINADVLIADTIYVMSNTNITVKMNAELNIENAHIFFGANSGIIVEHGGSLIANNSTLTYWNNSLNCTSDTSETWNGIVYEYGTLSTKLDIDSSTISYTKNGIQANSLRINFTNNNYLNNRKPLSISYASNNPYESEISNNTFINDTYQEPFFIEMVNFANANIENNQFGDFAYISDRAISISGFDFSHGNSATIKHNNFKNVLYPINLSSTKKKVK